MDMSILQLAAVALVTVLGTAAGLWILNADSNVGG
jgi:hypothetical protein